MGCCNTPQERQIHYKYAVDCNNNAWNYLDKIELNEEESNQLTHMIHASAWHWSQIGTPIQMARSYYMLAKTCFITKKPDEGCYWAQKCWEIVAQSQERENWDLPFSLEVMARAASYQNNKESFDRIASQFHELVQTLEKEDQEVTVGEWRKQPWFGYEI